ncbi:MAG: alpha/beta hydrolase [Rhodospirillaceae bacterium]|nr:alpha/beta hydrolase [Rhodospirillales bacterium]
MLGSVNRRNFLLGASALGLAACTSSLPASPVLGHVTVGAGPEAVVVLHEWLGDHTNYDAMVPYLSISRAQYVFADLRGYGLSRAMSGSYTMEEAAGDVVALMDSLGHARFHVVGHSMSGMIAQYLMAQYPDRIKSVIAISPVPATGFKTDATGMGKLRAVITDDEAFRTAVTARTSNRYGTGWVDRKKAMARKASPEAMQGYLAMFTSTDFAARTVGLTIPVALLTGAQDIPFYRTAALEPQFQRAYPRLQVATIADAGHYAMLETPVLLAALIERAVFAEPLNR